jgi:quinol monooxygenase YgiN
MGAAIHRSLPMLIVMATIRAQPAHAETLHRVITTLALRSRGEPGCSAYRVFRASEEPHVFVTYEQWASAQDERRHMAAAHVVEAFKAAGPLLAAPPDIRHFVEI